MKIQDIFFAFVLIGLIIVRKPRILVIAGIVCLILSIPLFAFWVFFTAQRLVYYASGFIFAAIIFMLISNRD